MAEKKEPNQTENKLTPEQQEKRKKMLEEVQEESKVELPKAENLPPLPARILFGGVAVAAVVASSVVDGIKNVVTNKSKKD